MERQGKGSGKDDASAPHRASASAAVCWSRTNGRSGNHSEQGAIPAPASIASASGSAECAHQHDQQRQSHDDRSGHQRSGIEGRASTSTQDHPTRSTWLHKEQMMAWSDAARLAALVRVGYQTKEQMMGCKKKKGGGKKK